MFLETTDVSRCEEKAPLKGVSLVTYTKGFVLPKPTIASLSRTPFDEYALSTDADSTTPEKGQLKAGSRFTIPHCPRRTVIVTDLTAPNALMGSLSTTTAPHISDTFGWDISYEEALHTSDIFPNENPLVAIVIEPPTYSSEDTTLVEELFQLGVNHAIVICPEQGVHDSRYRNFSTTFDASSGVIRIIPATQDETIVIETARNQQSNISLFQRYKDYASQGGVIAFDYIRDAFMLSEEQILSKHPCDHTLLVRSDQEKSEEAALIKASGKIQNKELDAFRRGLVLQSSQHLAHEAVERTGIYMTPRQIELFAKFRLMRDSSELSYSYGWTPITRENIQFVHPSQLPEHVLMAHVFKMTSGSETQLAQLEEWTRRTYPPTDTSVSIASTRAQGIYEIRQDFDRGYIKSVSDKQKLLEDVLKI